MGSSVQLRYQGGYTTQHALKVEEHLIVVTSLLRYSIGDVSPLVCCSSSVPEFKSVEKHLILKQQWFLMLLFFRSSSGTQFEGGSVDVYTMVENIKYPQDPDTHTITAAVHPELQVFVYDFKKNHGCTTFLRITKKTALHYRLLKISSDLVLSSRFLRIEISVSSTRVTPSSCLSLERHWGTKGKKRSILSSSMNVRFTKRVSRFL